MTKEFAMGEKETKKAETHFRKAQAKADGEAGTIAYAAARDAVITRTAKLREERLMREATLAEEAATATVPPAKRSKKKAAGAE
jgi:hypothetical protein